MADETLREQLSNAFDQIEDTPAPVEQPTEVAVEAEKPAVDRPRAADGKFLPNSEKPVLTTKETPQKTTQETQQNLTTQQIAEEPTWKRPPQSWKKDHHETYGALPPAIQEYIHQREMDMQKGVGSAREKAVFADKIHSVIQPYMDNIRVGAGGDVTAAVKGLMEADHLLRTAPPQQKVQLLANLAHIYGADFGKVVDMAGPHANALTAENTQLKMRVASLEAEKKEILDTRGREESEKTLQEIESFRHNHEHFDAVRSHMQWVIQTGGATTLEDAYKVALALNPGLSPARQAETDRQAKDQKAKAARSQAVSVRSSTPGATTTPKAQDRRSVLSEQFDNIGGRL